MRNLFRAVYCEGYSFLVPSNIREDLEKHLKRYRIAYKVVRDGVVTPIGAVYDVMDIVSADTVRPSMDIVEKWLKENWPKESRYNKV